MSNTENTSLTQDFRQAQEQNDAIMEEAQRLVNLYRQVGVLGDAFSAELDQKLLNISPEVMTALGNIFGGQIVRQYCLYLREKSGLADSDKPKDSPEMKQTGYLPTPDKDLPVFDLPATAGQGGASGADLSALAGLFQSFLATHQTELEQILNKQTDTLTQLLQQFDRHTNAVADAIKHESQQHNKYSEVIETAADAQPMTPFVSDDMEGF